MNRSLLHDFWKTVFYLDVTRCEQAKKLTEKKRNNNEMKQKREKMGHKTGMVLCSRKETYTMLTIFESIIRAHEITHSSRIKLIPPGKQCPTSQVLFSLEIFKFSKVLSRKTIKNEYLIRLAKTK
jgi:hypothetical protein